jgi:NAD(P)-dependent dehydrogenase (short-subunit alcohol dehydrogenase family)
MKKLDGKVVIITGAARGIGAAAARMFAAEGAKLTLVDVLEEPLRELARELEADVLLQIEDITTDSGMREIVENTVQRFGRVDAALLNAGIVGEFTSIAEYPLEVFDKVMAVNVKGVFLGLKYVMKAMEQGGGSIVITSSAAGVRATPNVVAYNTSKHATIGLMRSAAVEGASKGIRVNTVNPALTDTPLVAALDATKSDTAKARISMPMSHTIPMARAGTPEEVARLMLFLASDDSSFCTGGVYMVDGGVSAGRAF